MGSHDQLFKNVFSRPEQAAAELRCVLPTELVRRIDWSTLELQPGSSVDDDDLGERHADALYAVRIAGHDTLLHILLEHKSGPDDLVPFKLLRLLVRDWQRFVDDNPGAKSLPPVVAVVIHHDEKGWQGAIQLLDIVDFPDALRPILQPYVPNFRFVMDDLAVESESALRARRLPDAAKLALFCLQRARHSPDLLAELSGWADALRGVVDGRGTSGTFAALMRYIMDVRDLAPEVIRRFLRHTIGSRAEEQFMTTFSRILKETHAEGREEGREEGLAEGSANVLLTLLGERFGPVSVDVGARVRSAHADDLQRWARRLLAAESIDAVFAQ